MTKYLAVLMLLAVSLCGRAQTFIRTDFDYQNFSLINPAAEDRGILLKDASDVIVLSGRYDDIKAPLCGESHSDYHFYYRSNKDHYSSSVVYVHDSYSFYGFNSVAVNYARPLKLSSGAALRVGGGACMHFGNINYDKLCYYSGNRNDSRYFLPDVSIGVEYVNGRFRGGLSVINVLALTAPAETGLIQPVRSVMYDVSWDHVVNDNISFVIFSTGGCCQGLTADAGVYVTFRDKAGISYALSCFDMRSKISMTTNLGRRIAAGLACNFSSFHRNTLLSYELLYKW